MTRYHKILGVCIAFAGLTIIGDSVQAAEAGRESALQINKANELLRSGDLDAAMDAYEQAQQQGPQSPGLLYNLAVAHYRQGDIAAAEDLFTRAAASEDDKLAAKARYNLGNCNYAAAVHVAEQNRAQAIEHLKAAIAHYRSALAIDPSDTDARANIELAARLIEKLRNQEEQEQQQNQQQQSQQQQNQQDQQQQNQQQNQSGGQNEDSEEQSPQNGSQAGDQRPQQPEEDASEGDQAESQQEQQDAGAQQQEQQSQPQQRRQDESAEQSSGVEQASPPEERDDEPGKAPPEGELSAAGENDERSEEPNEQDMAAFDPSEDGEMTAQEAQKMLQAIRDREMLRRLRRQAAERERHIPVERDW